MRTRKAGTERRGGEDVARGVPRVLPTKRATMTYAPKIVGPDGEHRVHVAVSRVRPGGEVVEVWVDVVHKEGAPLRGFAHALARASSHALQYGTPLAVIVRSLLGTDGGPAGDVIDCDGVTRASSIPDLVGQVFALALAENPS